MGGQWVGPGQDRVIAFADELRVERFPTYYDGEHVAVLDGELVRHTEPFPPMPESTERALEEALRDLQQRAATVPLDRPWDAPHALELDSITFEEWLRSNIGQTEVREIVRFIADVQATPAAELSMLTTLFMLHSSIDFESMMSVPGGAQQERFVGGSQVVALRAAEELGDAVVLEHAVSRIEQRADHVLIDGGIAARRVIVTVPPVLAVRIAFDPPLPADKDTILSRIQPGSVIKVNVVYDEPFWRSDGLSGQALDPSRPFGFSLDNSIPGDDRGVIVGFFESPAARRLAGATIEERRELVLASLKAWFGPRAGRPDRYLELDWATEPWTRGCFAGKPTIGAFTSFGRALREPTGRIHWAGTETAMRWQGYLDGAVESGHRAAEEVTAALR
jgi:monoamine oxidase